MSMQLSYSELRRRLSGVGLWPEGRMARIACYLLGLAAGLFALQNLLSVLAPAWGAHLGGWVDFLTFIAGVLFTILGFRWLKQRVLWRLRNRLIVTYVFIGVIPVVLLVTLGFVTLYLFAGQFSGFVVTSELNSQMRSVEAANAAILNELAARLEHGNKPSVESLAGLKKRDREWSRREVCAWYGGKVVPLCSGAPGNTSFPFPDFFSKSENPYAKQLRDNQPFREIVRDHGQLYLRVASTLPLRTETLTVVTSEPLDKDLVAKFAHNLGEITLYAAGIRSENGSVDGSNTGTQSGLTVRPEPGKAALALRQGPGSVNVEGDQIELRPTFTVGGLPSPTGNLDREIQFGTPLRVVDWKTGESERAGALVRVRTLPSVLYGHLFASLGDFAKGVEYILLGVGIFFAIIEGIALFTGTRMTRTVTAAVAQLYDVNSMTESIEKLIQEQKEKQRLENELAIAQEVQAQLFPRQVSELESLEVHGFCRPARTVSGDYYDFLTASSHKLILAVGDISGKGISAALLMATIHSAVRAYSVENLPQMREPVAVGAVPEKYATLFLGIYDGRSHRLTYSNGGHLPPILISEDGTVRRLESGGTVIGLFDNMTYEEGAVEMQPSEIFVAYSDGVTEPENDFGEFGEQRLIDLVRENRHLPLPQISQSVTMAVDDWIGDMEQPDDVTLVLARAR